MIHKKVAFKFIKKLTNNTLNLNFFRFGMLFQFMTIFSGVVLILVFNQCKKDPVVLAPLNLDVVFFGHKGGGNNNFNKRFIENTLPSVMDGLKSMNGVEVDVQMSLDGTVWIYHNGDIGETSCQTNYHHCLILLKDSEIEKIQICANNIQDRIYKLKELVDYWKGNNEGFPISMHIKLDMGRDTLNHPLIGGELAYLLKLADKLAVLYPSIQNQDRIFVEVFDGAFRNKIHATIPRMKVCLLKEVPFNQQVDDAISGGYDGVSSGFDNASISAAEVKRARDNGLTVQLWTPDTKAEIIQAYNLKPNHIQTDNMYGAIICEPYYTPAK